MHSRKFFTAVLTVVLVMIVSSPAFSQRKMRNILFIQDKQQINQSDLVDGYAVEFSSKYDPIPNLVYIKNNGSFSIKLHSPFKEWDLTPIPGVRVNGDVIENITVTKEEELSFKTLTGQTINLSTYVHSYVVPSVDGKEIEGQTNLPNGFSYIMTEPNNGERFYKWVIRSDTDLERILSMKLSGMRSCVFITDEFPTEEKPIYLGGSDVKKKIEDKYVENDVFELKVSDLLQIVNGELSGNIKNPKNFVIALAGESEGSENDVYAPLYYNRLKLALGLLTWIQVIDERPAPIQKHSVTVSATAGGSATGGGNYPAATMVTVSATVDEGYEFDGWYEGETKVSSELTYTFQIQSDRALQARFRLKGYQVFALASSSEAGRVSFSYRRVTHGTTLSVEATANEGWVFSHWMLNGQKVENSTAQQDFEITAESTFVAVFIQKKVTLSVLLSPSEGGEVLIDGQKGATKELLYNQEVRLKATANDDFIFTGWKRSSGEVVSNTANEQTFTIKQDEVITAVFRKRDTQASVSGVKVFVGQSEAVFRWDAGSATSWTITVKKGDQEIINKTLSEPRLELTNLEAGTQYTYEIQALAEGNLPSQVESKSFTTAAQSESIAPYFSRLNEAQAGQVFDLVWVDLSDEERALPFEVFFKAKNSETVTPLRFINPEAKIKSINMPENLTGGTLLVRIKQSDKVLREIEYKY